MTIGIRKPGIEDESEGEEQIGFTDLILANDDSVLTEFETAIGEISEIMYLYLVYFHYCVG